MFNEEEEMEEGGGEGGEGGGGIVGNESIDSYADIDDTLESKDMYGAEGEDDLGVMPEDFTSQRERFEKEVLGKLGKNPFELDPRAELSKADRRLPELFAHVFKGQVTWQDRDKLSKKQSDFWQSTVNRYHADVYNNAVGQKKALVGKYNFMMNRFDNRRKEWEYKERTRLSAEREKRIGSGAPQMKLMVPEGGKESTWHAWDKVKRTWVDTKKTSKAPGQESTLDNMKVPPVVEKAQALMMKYAKTTNPIVAMMLTMNPSWASKPEIAGLLNQGIPEEAKPAYDQAVKIVNQWYKQLGEARDKGTAGANGAGGANGAIAGAEPSPGAAGVAGAADLPAHRAGAAADAPAGVDAARSPVDKKQEAHIGLRGDGRGVIARGKVGERPRADSGARGRDGAGAAAGSGSGPSAPPSNKKKRKSAHRLQITAKGKVYDYVPGKGLVIREETDEEKEKRMSGPQPPKPKPKSGI